MGLVEMSDRTNGSVAVLGTGIMGAAMARRLLDSGREVTVWNRSRSKAVPLGEEGAQLAESPADAVSSVDLVITMLTDGEAAREVMIESGGLEAMGGSTIWIQCSTVGIDDIEAFAAEAERRQVVFVDAPVLGTKEPAERGELIVLASGPEGVSDRCEDVFEVVARRTLWLGPAGTGMRLKLVVNNWLVGLVGTLAETVALARALDLDPALFLDAIHGSAVDAPYAQIKGRTMISGKFPPSFPLRLAHKDLELVLAAAGRHGLNLSIATTVVALFERAIDAGHADEDMAAVHAVFGSPS